MCCRVLSCAVACAVVSRRCVLTLAQVTSCVHMCVRVWCGVVWCGVVWCGVVWCGVVWCGVVWCGAVRCKAAAVSNRADMWTSMHGLPSTMAVSLLQVQGAGDHPD